MAKNINVSCDGCGTIVYGVDRGSFVQKDNIFINGQIGENAVDPVSKWISRMFFTPTAAERLVFCGAEKFWECFAAYLDTRRILWRSKQVRDLREQAGAEANDRLQRPAYVEKFDHKRPYNAPA